MADNRPLPFNFGFNGMSWSDFAKSIEQGAKNAVQAGVATSGNAIMGAAVGGASSNVIRKGVDAINGLFGSDISLGYNTGPIRGIGGQEFGVRDVVRGSEHKPEVIDLNSPIGNFIARTGYAQMTGRPEDIAAARAAGDALKGSDGLIHFERKTYVFHPDGRTPVALKYVQPNGHDYKLTVDQAMMGIAGPMAANGLGTRNPLQPQQAPLQPQQAPAPAAGTAPAAPANPVQSQVDTPAATARPIERQQQPGVGEIPPGASAQPPATGAPAPNRLGAALDAPAALNAPRALPVRQLTNLSLAETKQLQFMLEQQGQTTGAKNSAHMQTSAPTPDKMDGLFKERSNAALDAMVKTSGRTKEEVIGALMSGDKEMVASLKSKPAVVAGQTGIPQDISPQVTVSTARTSQPAPTPAASVNSSIILAGGDPPSTNRNDPSMQLALAMANVAGQVLERSPPDVRSQAEIATAAGHGR